MGHGRDKKMEGKLVHEWAIASDKKKRGMQRVDRKMDRYEREVMTRREIVA